jgi:rRNA-processing protein FCF1
MINVMRQVIVRCGRLGIIVDANLLLLYLIGRFDPKQISRFKRTYSFEADDYVLLSLILQQFQRIVTTPQVLTEVSNFSGQLAEPMRTKYFENLRTEICVLHEEFLESCEVASGGAFVKFGLTDAGIHRLAQSQYAVLTTDSKLYEYLASQGIDAINFNHLRPLGWTWLTEARRR